VAIGTVWESDAWESNPAWESGAWENCWEPSAWGVWGWGNVWADIATTIPVQTQPGGGGGGVVYPEYKQAREWFKDRQGDELMELIEILILSGEI